MIDSRDSTRSVFDNGSNGYAAAAAIFMDITAQQSILFTLRPQPMDG